MLEASPTLLARSTVIGMDTVLKEYPSVQLHNDSQEGIILKELFTNLVLLFFKNPTPLK